MSAQMLKSAEAAQRLPEHHGMRMPSRAAGSPPRRILPRRFALVGAFVFFAMDAAAQERVWLRAQLAADSRRIAAALEEHAGSDFSLDIAAALGGQPARQALLADIGDFAEAIDVPAIADREWTRALAIADRRGDTRASLALSRSIARSALALGDYDRARSYAERAAAIGRVVGNLSAQADAENILGIVDRRRAHLESAIERQQKARALFAEDGNDAGAMRALSDLGTVWRDHGDFAKALEAQLEALGDHDTDGDRLEHVYRNLGLLYRDIEDEAASRDYFRRALAAADQRGTPSAYSTSVGSYASLLNELGEYAGARDAAAEALAIDTALDDRPHQGLDHLELGRALLGMRENAAAIAHLEQALQLGRELRQREIVARALLHLTEAALAERDALRARGLIDEAIAGLEATHLRQQLAQAYTLREQLARSEGNAEEALRYAHKYAQVREDLVGVRTSRQLAALEVRHERADNEQRLALLAKDNELQAARIERQALVRDIGLIALGSLALAFGILVWRHRAVRRLNQQLAQRNAEFERQRIELDAANGTLRAQAVDLLRAATTDSLTQVANRGHLLHGLSRRLAEAVADQRRLAILLIDFDHFKKINDLRGHLFGDHILALGARAIRERLSDDDLLGRFGGEEFVAVVSDRDGDDAVALAEIVREHVADAMARSAPDLDGIATISIGVACLADLSAPVDSALLLEAADRALYLAKHDGRNRVRRFHPAGEVVD